jgi:hypothetical protein
MAKRKCGCIYTDARNTPAVRDGCEMGGYIKTPCAEHSPEAREARTAMQLMQLNAELTAKLAGPLAILAELAKLKRYDPNNLKRKTPYPARNLTLNVPAELLERIDAVIGMEAR